MILGRYLKIIAGNKSGIKMAVMSQPESIVVKSILVKPFLSWTLVPLS